jgi:EAL and modified HD-GYP domain-containing signal transduction protein
MEAFLARQPIFDSDLHVCGYELLHRSCRADGFHCADGDLASMQTLANTLLTFGPASVLSGKTGFVNFTRDLLVRDLAFLMPPERLVVEILESVEPDDEVISACRRLRSRGYALALDDFALNGSLVPLVEFAGFLKVDFRATAEPERRLIVRRFGRPGLCMLAEKVETQEEFAWARREGFRTFQGYFFARPVILANKDVPSFKGNLLRILAETHAPEFDFARVERLVKHELSLCYRLLRYVNSAAFGWRSRITTIRQAMALLGEEEMRRWLTLAALPVLASDKPDELAQTAVLRGRFCELLAPCAGMPHRGSDLFLLGLFSLLDVMVGRPLDELLGGLCLAEDVAGALLGKLAPEHPLTRVHRMVLAWERADWEAVAVLAERLAIPKEAVSDMYLEAVRWCAEIFHSRDLAAKDG